MRGDAYPNISGPETDTEGFFLIALSTCVIIATMSGGREGDGETEERKTWVQTPDEVEYSNTSLG